MTVTKSFNEFKFPPEILSALTELGHETPTAIQEQSIPILMEGGDLLAQAQTGTGKTAAFALPILSNLRLANKEPQALIIVPTRELAIQVAGAFQAYAKHLKGFHVIPIYGGQPYKNQLLALKRGSQVIVGTPGRVMDHLRRGTLRINTIRTVVLDEGDEMLNMGFIEDIEWILEKIPHAHQTALFSATMPPSFHKIATRYLKNAQKVHIGPTKRTVDSIEQCYIRVNNNQKLDVLSRFLEVEDLQAALIFTRTKITSQELADKLRARGYAAAALNGDMNQSLREKVIAQIKNGAINIIVATDVAARGIDVDRITHVVNFDIPSDTESYIHRIGRTGRAGRKGKALLFVTAGEYRLFQMIEREIHKSIPQMVPPSLQEMKAKRSKQISETVVNIIAKSKKLIPYREIVESIIEQEGCCPKDIAAALAYLNQQSSGMPLHDLSAPPPPTPPQRENRRQR